MVTDSVRDALGNQLVSTDAFRSCLGAPKEEYCRQLSVAEPTVAAFFPGGKILALSIFTTLSATAWLEGARVAAQYVAPEVKRVAMVRLRDFTAGILKLQTHTNPGTFEDLIVPVSVILSGGADRLFFGSYTAPDFLDSQQTDCCPAYRLRLDCSGGCPCHTISGIRAGRRSPRQDTRSLSLGTDSRIQVSVHPRWWLEPLPRQGLPPSPSMRLDTVQAR